MEVDGEHEWLGMMEVKYEDEEAMAGVAETLPFLLRKVVKLNFVYCLLIFNCHPNPATVGIKQG